MKSNYEDQIEASKEIVSRGATKVAKSIDSLTSSNLKRVLKMICHTHLADVLLGNPVDLELEDKEKDLIDDIFMLQEAVMGYQTLMEELKASLQEESGLETVDLAISLEENNNE